VQRSADKVNLDRLTLQAERGWLGLGLLGSGLGLFGEAVGEADR
jgi:hypothetical protein